MYSHEYKCTSIDTEVITINITTVKLSNKNPQSKVKSSLENQLHNVKQHVEPAKPTSKKIKQHIKKVIKIENVEITRAPLVPIKRPKKAQTTLLKKGKKIIEKYIINLI